MKKLIKKIFGFDKIQTEIENEIKEKQVAKEIAEKEAKEAEEAARLAKLSPKELANEKKESYIAVLDTKVNKDNVRNGFFELDWNEYFVVELRLAGYTGETDEEVVDKWFQDLCRNIASESGIDMADRGSGYVQRALREDGRTEIG